MKNSNTNIKTVPTSYYKSQDRLIGWKLGTKITNVPKVCN